MNSLLSSNVKQHGLNVLKITLMYIILDNLWFLYSYSRIYAPAFKSIQQTSDLSYMGKKMFTTLGGPLSWLLLGLGLYVFVINPSFTSNASTVTTILLGLLYGLVVYGVYNGTNVVTLLNYTWSTGMYDLLWGTFVSGLITVIYLNLDKIQMWKQMLL